MASSSSEPAPKIEYGTGGDGSGGGGGGGGGGEITEVKLKGPDEVLLYRGLKRAKKERGCTAKERISKMPPCTAGKRSSIYRGVTRHRWTGRYEAHLWDKSTWNQNQNKKGKQVYLGAYDDEEAAARAYDLAALKYWGPGTLINFPVTDYARDLEEMQNLSREDYLASLRRKSSGFSRGISKLRPLSSRWDSQFGHMPGSDYLNNINYGDDASTEHAYAGGFCIDRKIDLTSYIKWWGVNKSKTNQSEVNLRPSKDKQIEEITGELKAPDWSVKHTEPYEMPKLGLNIEVKKNKSSVLSLLSKSVAFKSFEEKASRMKEVNENDENENKNIIINKLDRGKGIEEESGFGMNVYSLAPFITAPLLSSYNSVDTLPDPVLWGTLVPTLTTGSSVTNEVTKNEPSSGFTFFNPEG